MELRRFFVDRSQIDGDKITVVGDEYTHLAKVLRFKTGYRCIICCNDGVERFAEITEITKDAAFLREISQTRVDFKNLSLTLYAGLLKNNKLDFTIQKSVELGVDRVVPFTSDNCAETKFQTERANRIALEAAKQCGSAYLSEVGDLVSLDGVISQLANFDAAIFAYEKETAHSLKAACEKFKAANAKNIALIIGPEGGFTEVEAQKIIAAGAYIATLGKRILRAETAAIVASALLLDSMGELAQA